MCVTWINFLHLKMLEVMLHPFSAGSFFERHKLLKFAGQIINPCSSMGPIPMEVLCLLSQLFTHSPKQLWQNPTSPATS